MPTGGFIGWAPVSKSSGNGGANSIFLTPLVAQQNAIATAVLLDVPGAVGSISLKAVIYDSAHSVLLASGSAVTSVAANYNRLPLTANLNLTAGTTYYVGYVCANSLAVSVQIGAGPTSWWASGGQSVASPANPLATGATSTTVLMIAVELDGTGSQGFGWGADFTPGVTLSTSNTLASLTSAASLGVRGIATNLSGAGKFYFEIDVAGTVGSGVAVGIASANAQITDTTMNAAAYRALLNAVGNRSGSVALGLTYASGDTIGVAYDGINNLVWWNKNNVAWFGASSTAGNPVTATGGFAIPSATWPVTPIAGTVAGSAATFTLRDTAGNLRYGPPSGYAAWSPAIFPVMVASSQARVMVLA